MTGQLDLATAAIAPNFYFALIRVQSIVCKLCVCLSVCLFVYPQAYLKIQNHKSKLH